MHTKHLMSESHIFSFNAETGECVIYGREPASESWTTTKLTFQEANELSHLAQSIYMRGYERGLQEQEEAVQAALLRRKKR